MRKNEKVGFVGSRQYMNKQAVVDAVNALPDGTTVVSGGCHGPDKWAEEAAIARGLQTEIYEPYFRREGHPMFGKYATWHFFARNTEIAEASDRLVAFYDGIAGGTHDTVTKARRMEKPVQIVRD